ncbi:hypothetical protein BGZ96_005395, partial [Linnemannia gamsii]
VVTSNGDVLPFASNLQVTSKGSKIITYRVDGTTASFNSFDTTTGKWAGIGLKAPPPKPSSPGNPSTPGGGNSGNINGGANTQESGGAPIGAIVGGVVGALVVVALVAFLFIRNRRQKKNAAGPLYPTYLAETSQQPGTDQKPLAAAAVAHPVQSSTPAYQESPYTAGAQLKPEQQQQFQSQQQQQQQQQLQPQQPQQFQPQQPQQFQQQQQQPQQFQQQQPQLFQQQQPQLFQQQQPQQFQPPQQPGFADPRLSYNPYTAASGQPPIPIVQSQAGQHPTIFQPHQAVYSISPVESQQAYVYPPGTQSGSTHSQPSPVHYQTQTTPGASGAGASVGSPSQTPVVYTPPTVTGYTHPPPQ